MKPVFEHALIVLEKAEDWVTNTDLANEVQLVFPKADMRLVFKKLRNTANIGHDSKLGYRYYEPSDLTNKVQECLDRGDNW